MANDMYRVRTVWNLFSGGVGLSTHYFVSTSATFAGAQAVVDRVRDFWAALKPSILSNGTYVVQAQVDVLDYTSGALINGFTVTQRADGGSASGVNLPPATQALIRWDTGQIINGHRFRGRTYVPNLPTGVSNGNTSGTLLTNVPSAVTAINLAATDSFVIWHRPIHPGPTGSGGLIRGVTAGTLQQKFAVLRGRRD